MAGFQLFSIAGRRRRLEPQINADISLGWRYGLDELLDRDAQPPIPDRILGETAGLKANPLQSLPLEHPEMLPREPDRPAATPQLLRLERDPAERALRSAADPEAQLRFLCLITPYGILGVDPLDRA